MTRTDPERDRRDVEARAHQCPGHRQGTSKLALGNIANTALVQIERYKEPLPAITAFTPPKMG